MDKVRCTVILPRNDTGGTDMDHDKMQALAWGPLENLAGMMGNSEATAEECADLLRLVVAGVKVRMEQG